MRPVIAAAALTLAGAAHAQTDLSVGAEAATQEARRGLSWSQGRASISADATATLGAIDASVRIAALRGSMRHAGADAVVDASVGANWTRGAIGLRVSATGHGFTGADAGMNYAELGAEASYSFGPLRASAGALYAPLQRAIGGSNLYLYAGADASVPGTPFTLIAGVGRSSGAVDDPVRAQRLRPGGRYADWRLGVEHRRDHLTLGLDYIGTDVARADAFGPFSDARHAGDRLVARARVSF